jgi:hypothetical protein
MIFFQVIPPKKTEQLKKTINLVLIMLKWIEQFPNEDQKNIAFLHQPLSLQKFHTWKP